MISRRAFIVAAALIVSACQGAAAQATPPELVAAMQKGGLVIYLRHAQTNQEEVDTGRLGDRAGQRNLSPAGRDQARRLGEAFRALRIPLRPILASPVFRARDTAEIAFGAERIEVTMDLVADEYAGRALQAMIAATRRLLLTSPAPGTNRLLVGHRTPLEMVTRRRFPDTILPEGALAIFSPGGDAPRLLGTLTSDDLVSLVPAR